MARNYSANLREEVIKGMLEKCRQGIYPGNPPYGYMIDKVTKRIVAHPEKSKIVRVAFGLYATGDYSIVTLKKELEIKHSVQLSRTAVENMLKNRFYIGSFVWRDEVFAGNHPLFIGADLFKEVQNVLQGDSKPKGRHQEIAFRGVLRCKYCGCMITGERKQGRYVYYRCTYAHGDCGGPRFREQEVIDRMATAIEAIKLPKDVALMIESKLQAELDQIRRQGDQERVKLSDALSALQCTRAKAYTDKLNGDISADFWRTLERGWADEELSIKAQISSLEDGKTDNRLKNLHKTLELVQGHQYL